MVNVTSVLFRFPRFVVYANVVVPIHVLLLLMFATVPKTFINPAFQSLFTEMIPSEKRGRMFAALGGAGIWVTGVHGRQAG